MSISQLPNGKWRLQIRRKYLDHDQVFESKKEAQLVETELLKKPKPGKGDTITTLWLRYQESNDFAQKSEQTQITERNRIKHVLAAMGGVPIQELEGNPARIYDYIDARKKQRTIRTNRPVGNGSIRLEIAALSAVVEFAKKRRIVRENFVSGISRPTVKPRTRRIESTEQGGLNLACRHADYQVAKAGLLRSVGA